MPLLDLHAHFPMHLHFPPEFSKGPPPLGKEVEFWAANMLLNFQGGKPRVSLPELMAGPVGGIGSVLHDPDDEFFRSAKPLPNAFGHVLAQMDLVEKAIGNKVKVARNPPEVRNYLEAGDKFLFHCLEGGFGLGGNPANVDVLAARGVAYVTVAHLFYRGVASCENAIPFVADRIFERILNRSQKPRTGLTRLGREIVGELLTKRILVDITHCNELAQQEIFHLAREHEAPVIASHTGVRHTSNYALNLSDSAIEQISASKGVIGIIVAQHWLRQPHNRVNDGFELVFRAIEHVHDVVKNYDCIAIGSDLDGFIKPISGCETYSKTSHFLAALQQRYPESTHPGVADKISYRNALAALERGWTGTKTLTRTD